MKLATSSSTSFASRSVAGRADFFVMDENFLLNKKRAMELLARMKEHNKAGHSSLRIRQRDPPVHASKNWWNSAFVGVDGTGIPRSNYDKLKGTDTLELTHELRQHGIKLLGSTIIGLEHHTPENIGQEIEYAVAHQTDFHQFMLYTPVPGTPLYQEMPERDACWMASTWPTFTVSTNSTSGMRPFRAMTRNGFSIGRSFATMS